MSAYEQLEELGIDLKGRRSGSIKTPCPWCGPERKKKNDLCLSTNVDEGLYYCHHCGTKGRVFDKTGGAESIIKPTRLIKHSEKVLQFFENERKISSNTLIRLGITEAKEAMPPAPEWKVVNTICFNYYRGTEIVNIKYRARNKQF